MSRELRIQAPQRHKPPALDLLAPAAAHKKEEMIFCQQLKRYPAFGGHDDMHYPCCHKSPEANLLLLCSCVWLARAVLVTFSQDHVGFVQQNVVHLIGGNEINAGKGEGTF